MDVVLVFPSDSASRQVIARAIKSGGKVQVDSEGGYIICESSDPANLVSRLVGFSGIDSVAIARKVPRRFSHVTSTIAQPGSKEILPGETFYVKSSRQPRPIMWTRTSNLFLPARCWEASRNKRPTCKKRAGS